MNSFDLRHQSSTSIAASQNITVVSSFLPERDIERLLESFVRRLEKVNLAESDYVHLVLRHSLVL